jgi:peptidoglycan/xylan/chitin deacetylase (PgdA/CDA1 family)
MNLAETCSRVIKVTIAMLFFACTSIRLAVFRLAGYPIAPTFVVLMYHSVKSRERERFARQMEQLVSIATPVYADFAGSRTSDGHRSVAVTFDDAYQSVLENAIPILRERRIPATLFVPTKYLGGQPAWITNERHRNADERLLTIDELRCVRKDGGLIGSHGVTHRSFTQLNHAEALAELIESREVLENISRQRVNLLALPYGSSNTEVLRIATQAGYERVFLNVPRRSAGNFECLIGRIEVSPTDWALEYGLKIRGAYQWLPLAIAAKGRLMNVLGRFL